MIREIPINISGEKPGAADWRQAEGDEAVISTIDRLSATEIPHSYVDITVDGSQVVADVFTDDVNMQTELDEYFRLNNALRVRYADSEEVETQHQARILYLTNHGLQIGNERLGSSGLPYEGIFDASGENFIAVGRKSIGTFKSMVIGAMSSILANRRALLPIHSAIVEGPSGKSIAFSGRGNMGKTTSLLSVFESLSRHGYKVVTDDWSMIKEETGEVMPVDYLVSVRPESLEGLRHVHSDDWVDYFTGRVLSIDHGRSKSRPLGLSELYGPRMVGKGGHLGAVVLTSAKKIYSDVEGRHIPVDFTELNDPQIIGLRIRDDAYHAPTIQASDITGDPSLDERYVSLAESLDGALVFTRVDNSRRRQQAEQMVNWILSREF